MSLKAKLAVQRATKSATVPPDEQFQLWADAALAKNSSEITLAIRIVDGREGQRFNRDYRGKDYATNVLSFPADLPQGLPEELLRAQLGDLLICAPVVAREARQRNCPEVNHWAHLTIHGVLHLLGHDHEQTENARDMESLETEILAQLGFPDPYQTGSQ